VRPALLPLDALSHRLPATRTTDAIVARRCLGRVFARHALEVRGGRLDFMHQHANLGETSISLLRYGSEVEIIAPPLDFYMLQVTLSGRIGLRAAGFEVTLEAGSAFVMNPGVGYRKRWDREAQQLMLKIPRCRLEARTLDLARMAPARAIEFTSTALPAGALAEPVCQLLDQLGDGEHPSDFRCRQSPAIRASENDLVDALLTTLPYRLVACREPAAGCAVPHYIWRAERHLRANSGSPVKIAALAELTGVSERTLQEGFQRFRGKPPSRVSRDRRLDLARAALARPGSENVTAVALAFGFTHLGRFAQTYAERFGEYPSETLRRRRPQ
jgi:AraC-like DNA-binding protein